MLRKMIERRTGKLTDRQWRLLSNMVTADIHVNRQSWGRATTLRYVLWVAEVVSGVNRRAAG